MPAGEARHGGQVGNPPVGQVAAERVVLLDDHVLGPRLPRLVERPPGPLRCPSSAPPAPTCDPGNSAEELVDRRGGLVETVAPQGGVRRLGRRRPATRSRSARAPSAARMAVQDRPASTRPRMSPRRGRCPGCARAADTRPTGSGCRAGLAPERDADHRVAREGLDAVEEPRKSLQRHRSRACTRIPAEGGVRAVGAGLRAALCDLDREPGRERAKDLGGVLQHPAGGGRVAPAPLDHAAGAGGDCRSVSAQSDRPQQAKVDGRDLGLDVEGVDVLADHGEERLAVAGALRLAPSAARERSRPTVSARRISGASPAGVPVREGVIGEVPSGGSRACGLPGRRREAGSRRRSRRRRRSLQRRSPGPRAGPPVDQEGRWTVRASAAGLHARGERPGQQEHDVLHAGQATGEVRRARSKALAPPPRGRSAGARKVRSR